MPESEDLDKLLQGCARRERSALERLYEAVGGRLYALAYYMLRQEDLAEQALQSAFATIWWEAGSFDRQRLQAMAWLVAIQHQHALAVLAQQPPRDARPGEVDAQFGPRPMELVLQLPEERPLTKALRGLTVQERQGIVLAYYRGFNHLQLSLSQAIPLPISKNWVRRGLLKLRRSLEP